MTKPVRRAPLGRSLASSSLCFSRSLTGFFTSPEASNRSWILGVRMGSESFPLIDTTGSFSNLLSGAVDASKLTSVYGAGP